MALAAAPGSENPSAAYLAGQQHGASLAAQHHAAATAPAKTAPAKQPAAPNRKPAQTQTAPGQFDLAGLLKQAQALAQAQTQAQIKAIQAQQGVYTQQGQDRATQINAATQAAAKFLSGLGDQTAASYTDAAKSLGSLASGFSGQVGTDATNAANQIQANLANLGAPSDSAKTATGQTSSPTSLSNVLYGLGGFIPGNLLLTSGEGAAAAARALPAGVLGAGQEKAAGALAAGQDRADTLTPQILDAQGKQPGLAQSLYGSLLDGIYKNANLGLSQQKLADAEKNSAFDQKYKVATYNLNVTKANQAATRIANAQFNADRNYQVTLARLGIAKKAQQQAATVAAFKAAHGGYTKAQLTKYETQANGLANSYFHGTSVTKTIDGVPKTTATSGLPYNAALSQLMRKGIPVQVALKSLDRVYPASLRPSPEALKQLLGPLTPDAVAAQAQVDATTPFVAGLSETSPSTILTQASPQTRAVKSYAFANAASKYGWHDAANLAALDKLWTQESGWNPNAVNPSSGAAGIPQALGHGNVFKLGDYKAQVDWGLKYILGRYGSPLAAWQHEVANNWY